MDDAPRYQYRLTRICFADGSEVCPGPLTVLVGANNVGKSRALKDIAVSVMTGGHSTTVIVRDISWTWPADLASLRAAYDVERHQERTGGWARQILDPHLCTSRGLPVGAPWPAAFERIMPEKNAHQFGMHFGPFMVAHLTSNLRLDLVKQCRSPNDDQQVSSILHALYNAGRPAELQLRQAIQQAFGKEVALDLSTPHQLLLRLGEDFSSVPSDPRDARPIMAKYDKLDEQGDGIRSFVGVVAAMQVIRRPILLIDEPEAFLHPPQARRIGQLIAEQADDFHQTIVATHSADVLRGMLSKSKDLTVIRIARDGNRCTTRTLDQETLRSMANDPLLTSARVFEGLFYSGSVVVEADSDARFYQAASGMRREDADLHFVNADNKQTVPRIMAVYRALGVPCVGIVDFDVLNNRSEFEKQLEALGLERDVILDLLNIQTAIAQATKDLPADERLSVALSRVTELSASIYALRTRTFSSEDEAATAKDGLLRTIERRCREIAEGTKAWAELKRKGRGALPPALQVEYDRLSKACAARGLFINPSGELESMLIDCGIEPQNDKKTWIRKALQVLPNLRTDDEKHPWRFLQDIHSYFDGVAAQRDAR